MTSTMKGSLVLVALLAAPSVVFGAQRDRFDRRRMQAEIRRDVQESLRDARRMRWEAGRRIRRASGVAVPTTPCSPSRGADIKSQPGPACWQPCSSIQATTSRTIRGHTSRVAPWRTNWALRVNPG